MEVMKRQGDLTFLDGKSDKKLRVCLVAIMCNLMSKTFLLILYLLHPQSPEHFGPYILFAAISILARSRSQSLVPDRDEHRGDSNTR